MSDSQKPQPSGPSDAVALSWFAVYVVIALLTYGWSHHHPSQFRHTPPLYHFMCGAFWPVYWVSYPLSWAGELAIEITAPTAEW